MDVISGHRRGDLNHLLRTSLGAAALSGAVVLAAAAPEVPADADAATLAAGASTPNATASAMFSFSDPRITESSGLAASSFDASVYTHNDSGDSARFFRVDSHGDTVAVYTLRGATNVDWEDMATSTDAAGNRLLYLADIGDNARNRKEIEVYEVDEPRGPGGDVPWVRYRFAYPDGAHDAEALLVDPRSHRLYIATKSLVSNGELYAAPATLNKTSVNMLAPVRSVPPMTTSADFAPDGSHIVLLTYFGASWADGIDGTLHPFRVPLQRQNEAIAFTVDGSGLLVGSEGVHSAVYRVAVPWTENGGATPTTPTTATARPAPRPAPSAASTAKGDRTSAGVVVVIATLAGIALLVLAFIGYAVKRRGGQG